MMKSLFVLVRVVFRQLLFGAGAKVESLHFHAVGLAMTRRKYALTDFSSAHCPISGLSYFA
jgi:hypothetical protein